MAMRITQSTLFSRALFDMQRGLFRYSQLQTEVATGRRVNRPSDDPAAALQIMPLRGELRDLEQFNQNVSLARETLNTSAASLEDGSSVMQRVRELATQAANGTLSGSDRESISAEVDQLLDQMLGIANSRRGERYRNVCRCRLARDLLRRWLRRVVCFVIFGSGRVDGDGSGRRGATCGELERAAARTARRAPG